MSAEALFATKLDLACQIARISRVADLTKLDFIDLPTVQVIRPFSKNFICSLGKGQTLKAARISAIMESLECYHSECISPFIHATTGELKTALTYDLSLIHLNKYAHPCDWVESFDLFADCSTYLPHTLVCQDYTASSNERNPEFPCKQTSNGLAGGTTEQGAVIHALLETIERHGISSEVPWKVPLCENIEFILGAYFERLRKRDFKMGIFFYETIIGLPIFQVKIFDPCMGLLFEGSACRPEKEESLLKAFEEALQGRTAFIAGARDDFTYASYSRANQFPLLNTASANTKVARTILIKDWESIPCHRKFVEQFAEKERMTFILNCLKSANISSVLRTNLTQKEIDIPFVHVFVPSLEMNLEHVL